MEETKAQFSEVWTTLRHRLETSDREMSRIGELLDGIKGEVDEINTKSIQINTMIEAMRQSEGEMGRQIHLDFQASSSIGVDSVPNFFMSTVQNPLLGLVFFKCGLYARCPNTAQLKSELSERSVVNLD